jgi:Acyl-CoA carboxylase epsilon subunit
MSADPGAVAGAGPGADTGVSAVTLTVVRGRPSEEEIAVLVSVLSARACADGGATDLGGGPDRAPWGSRPHARTAGWHAPAGPWRTRP